MLILQDQLTRLELCPELGGAIGNWSLRSSGLPLLRHADSQALAAGSARRLGCFPLLPWSNRIGSGGFANPHGWLALAANCEDPLPIHGSAWQQPWRVAEHDAQGALLTLESELPFAYSARQRFDLRDGQLCITLEVTHRGDSPAWYGLGLHPYFPRTANTRLQVAAEALWLCDEQRLSRELAPVPEDWDFANARPLPATCIDHAFAGWNGRACIHQPDLGYRLDCVASHCSHYLLFTPQERGFFCVEPVSHPVNAHHLPGRPGLRLLATGASARLGWSMSCRLIR